MPYVIRNVGTFVTSSAGAVTNILGHIDDASSLTVYVSSSGTFLTSAGSLTVKVAPWDWADSTSIASGENLSTAFFTLAQSFSTTLIALSSGQAISIGGVSFRALRLSNSQASGNTDGEIIAWVTKQISV